MIVLNRLERGVYRDSVVLMRVARALAERPGIESAALMMRTPANKALMRDARLLAGEGDQAAPSDLVIALRAADEAAAQAGLAAALELLEEKSAAAPELIPRSRTLAGALEMLPGANLAIVSVPGEFAALQARSALEHGLHALVFSDNVPIEDELALKRLAREKGLLLMGPDCGT